MGNGDASFLPLRVHADTPGRAVRSVAARAGWVGPDFLRLGYRLEGDLRGLRIPPARDAGRGDRLWAHTCFEAFIGLEESPRYLELNFSPSGEWAAYRFEGYRQGMEPIALEEPPRLTMRRGEQRLELEAELRWGGALPEPVAAGVRAGAAGRRMRIALSAVVEEQEGRLSYWALRHPSGRPDFHHPESFSLTLELPSQSLNFP